MNKVKMALVGAGFAARKHLEVIEAIDWIEPVGIASRTRSKAEALAREFKITVVADDLSQLMRKAHPDALLLLVTEEQMPEVAGEAMQYGVPLFLEKPAGLTPETNRGLVALAREKKVRTMVGFNRRFYSVFHQGIDIIKKHGELQGIVVEDHERMWRIREGGKFSERVLENWIYANGTHVSDLIRFFAGEVKDIVSFTNSLFEKNGDQFASVMKMESGALAHFIAHWYSPGGWRVALYGDGVTVEFKPLEVGKWIDKKFEEHVIVPDEVDVKYKPGFYRQMEAFGGLVRDGVFAWPMLDLEGSLRTMEFTQKIASL